MNTEQSLLESITGMVTTMAGALFGFYIYMQVFEYAYNTFFKSVLLIDLTQIHIIAITVLFSIISHVSYQVDTSEKNYDYWESVFMTLFFSIVKPLLLLLFLWLVKNLFLP